MPANMHPKAPQGPSMPLPGYSAEARETGRRRCRRATFPETTAGYGAMDGGSLQFLVACRMPIRAAGTGRRTRR